MTHSGQCRNDPNPVRDERVKLPRERKAHIPPPLAEHVERVAGTVAGKYVLPLLVIDECGCGPCVTELATAEVGDVDEHRSAIRVRWTVEKNERYRHLPAERELRIDAFLVGNEPKLLQQLALGASEVLVCELPVGTPAPKREGSG